jgi:hypothetical protein
MTTSRPQNGERRYYSVTTHLAAARPHGFVVRLYLGIAGTEFEPQ